VLAYGNSLAQIQQISVDLAHNRGFTGAGVLCAIFDTGFRKDHQAFATALAESRLIAEWDFVFDDGDVQNEPEDVSSAHNHGTSCWSVLGGEADGQLYGPAYGASFLLAKTEDIRSETQVEEDNWLAAVEWSDSLGADVISSSLTYSDWYTYSDYDGLTCVTTLAANLATMLGIVVCNAAGNSGPSAGSLGAPVDAFNILSAGSVTSTGALSSFSSRGPTPDGRIKPEVCARGSSTWLASASGTTTYGSGSGTSFACPLVAGCAALVREAHTAWNPLMVREAMMQTASRAATPDNNYGWGIVNVNAAIDYTGSVVIEVLPLEDTVLWLEDTLPVQVVAASISPVDLTGSMLYSREQGGSFTATALSVIAGDLLEGGIPRPAAFPATMEYYFEVSDSVGFSSRAPESLGAVFTVVWDRSIMIGDINHDQVINASDIIELVTYVFKSGSPPVPVALGEVDGTPPINASDIVYLVTHVFKSGPPPVTP
jgi:subtilisin family serine protease